MNLTGQPVHQKVKPYRSRVYRHWIAMLPCLTCGRPDRTQCAHVRIGWFGKGYKPGDDMTVPLCVECHRAQHDCKDKQPGMSGEESFWSNQEINPRWYASRLFALYPDKEAARIIVLGARPAGRVR